MNMNKKNTHQIYCDACNSPEPMLLHDKEENTYYYICVDCMTFEAITETKQHNEA